MFRQDRLCAHTGRRSASTGQDVRPPERRSLSTGQAVHPHRNAQRFDRAGCAPAQKREVFRQGRMCARTETRSVSTGQNGRMRIDIGKGVRT